VESVSLFELFNLGSPDATDWMLDALCAETDPEVFFPDRGAPNRDAKRVCAACSVRVECLEDALAKGERAGVRGGLSEMERRALLRQRRASVQPSAVA
jgi:WhiB family redox-sensing transcriptional regulator